MTSPPPPQPFPSALSGTNSRSQSLFPPSRLGPCDVKDRKSSAWTDPPILTYRNSRFVLRTVPHRERLRSTESNPVYTVGTEIPKVLRDWKGRGYITYSDVNQYQPFSFKSCGWGGSVYWVCMLGWRWGCGEFTFISLRKPGIHDFNPTALQAHRPLAPSYILLPCISPRLPFYRFSCRALMALLLMFKLFTCYRVKWKGLHRLMIKNVCSHTKQTRGVAIHVTRDHRGSYTSAANM